jgi:hypothetical protein
MTVHRTTSVVYQPSATKYGDGRLVVGEGDINIIFYDLEPVIIENVKEFTFKTELLSGASSAVDRLVVRIFCYSCISSCDLV